MGKTIRGERCEHVHIPQILLAIIRYGEMISEMFTGRKLGERDNGGRGDPRR